MAISKEAKVGLIVFTAIVVLFWGVNYLKGRDFFTTENLIYAVYDRVEGLAPSNVVEVNGLKIGLISSISLLPDHSGRIIAAMHIKKDLKIPRNSTAQIFSIDFLGTKGIRLVYGDSPDDIHNHDTLRSDIEKNISEQVSAQVAPLKAKAENLLSSLDTVTYILRDVFNEDTKENLKRSFSSITSSLNSMEHITKSVDTMMSKEDGKLKMIFDNIQTITSDLKTVVANIGNISDTLKHSNIGATIENTRKTLEQTSQIFEKVNKGKGSLGLLVNNDSLYINLNNTARDLDILLKDLKLNPKKYVHFSFIGK